MSEITGVYHILNGEIKNNKDFDDSFLNEPKYLYEVFRTIDKIPLFIEDHLSRFEQSVNLNNDNLPFSKNEIFEQVDTLIQYNDFKDHKIKMVFLPSNFNQKQKFLLYHTPKDYPSKLQYLQGVPVSFYYKTRENPNVKLMDTFLRSNTDKIKVERNVYETILVDPEGYITEGSRSNIFFINDNDYIYTPPLDYVLPGITRKYIIQLCEEMGIKIIERMIHIGEVKKMKAVFISGTSRKVLPVNKIENLQFSVKNPLLLEIKDSFDKKIERYIKERK